MSEEHAAKRLSNTVDELRPDSMMPDLRGQLAPRSTGFDSFMPLFDACRELRIHTCPANSPRVHRLVGPVGPGITEPIWCATASAGAPVQRVSLTEESRLVRHGHLRNLSRESQIRGR